MVFPRNLRPKLEQLAQQFPVVTLTGPRQSGKTTLCRQAFAGHAYVSLERPDHRAFARDDPKGFLAGYAGGVILDEIQHAPELPSWIQPLVDDDPRPGRFILTGSENLTLTAATSQSLAGRTAILHLLPFDQSEIESTSLAGSDLVTTLWRGGYPAIFDRGLSPTDWLAAYAATFVERDVRQLLNITELEAFRTFLGLCAGRSASLLNASEIGRDAGISHHTARSWLSVLEACYLVYRLPPWHRSFSQRLIKSPKLHFWDSGLACYLLGITEPGQLVRHPLRGALFESWVVSEVHKWFIHRGLPVNAWFYRDQRQLEVDLLVQTPSGLLALEIKSGATIPPAPFESLKRWQALSQSAGAEPPRIGVIYGGDDDQLRSEGSVVSWRRVSKSLEGLER